MAKSKDIKAYKEAQRLVMKLHETTKKAPKELRFTLVQRLLSESVEMIVDIDSANRARGQDRVEKLELAKKRNARLDVLLFVAMEQRCLSKDAAAQAIQHVDNLGKQLHGWHLSTASQLPHSPAQKTEISK